jgi:hypothetical protein
LDIRGNSSGLFNVVEFFYSSSVNINTYNASLCAVRRISNSGGTLLTYRPGDAIPQFTQFIPNSGYIILAKNNFVVPEDQLPPAGVRTFPGSSTGIFSIIQYPFSLSQNVNTYSSSLCAVRRASATGGSLLTVRPTDTIPQFTQFASNSGYLVLARHNFSVVNPSSTWNLSLVTTGTNEGFGFTILGERPTFVVEWGNGQVRSLTAEGTYTATYATPGPYTMKLYGSFGNVGGNIQTFGGSGNCLKSVSAMPFFPNFTDASIVLGFNQQLNNIHENLFTNNPQITSFSAAFFLTQNLAQVPSTLFANQLSVVDASIIFSNAGLREAPTGLLHNKPRLKRANSMFSECNNLTTVGDIFGTNTQGVESLEGLFINSRSLSAIQSNLFSNLPNLKTIRNAFSQAHGLSALPETLFSNNFKMETFESAFFNCINLRNIPANLFTNNRAVTSFDSTFGICFNLSAIPDTLFFTNTAVTTFEECFAACNQITPESYSNLLINLASNAFLRQNNVPFGTALIGYKIQAQTARDTLTAKGWVFNDGGLIL